MMLADFIAGEPTYSMTAPRKAKSQQASRPRKDSGELTDDGHEAEEAESEVLRRAPRQAVRPGRASHIGARGRAAPARAAAAEPRECARVADELGSDQEDDDSRDDRREDALEHLGRDERHEHREERAQRRGAEQVAVGLRARVAHGDAVDDLGGAGAVGVERVEDCARG